MVALVKKLCIATALTLGTCCWLYYQIGPRTALINITPTGMLLSAAVLFVHHAWPGRKAVKVLFVAALWLLTLRLPITLQPALLVIPYLLLTIVVVLVAMPIARPLLLHRHGKAAIALTCLIILINTATHIGIDSPYTHTFHLFFNMPSAFAGADNNQTWECIHEVSWYAVHCDARHFIATEKIFVDETYDPRFSVVMTRMFSGYLYSLLGTDNWRWLASIIINTVFWLLNCLCIARLNNWLGLPNHQGQIAMLCAASAWGFVSMVGQPAPYALSYAFATFCIAAAIYMARVDKCGPEKTATLYLLIAAAALVYEMLPIFAGCAVLLLLQKRYRHTVAFIVVPVLALLSWRLFGLNYVLQTAGADTASGSGSSNLLIDLTTWHNIATTKNLTAALHNTTTGATAWALGSPIYAAAGAIAGMLIAHLRRQYLLRSALLWVNLAMIAAMIFIVPQMTGYAPATGMQPRIAFIGYAINLIALTTVADQARRLLATRFASVTNQSPAMVGLLWLPLTLFLMAQADVITGWASHAVLFDYGSWQHYRYW